MGDGSVLDVDAQNPQECSNVFSDALLSIYSSIFSVACSFHPVFILLVGLCSEVL